MAGRAASLSINRAPVLTLWAAVVAERLGFGRDEALTLGRAVAGLNAQSKGRRIGVFKPHEEKPKEAREKDRGERFLVEVCGRDVPAVSTPDGLRAVSAGKPIDPEAVEQYLEGAFGDDLAAVRAAMRRLARRYAPADLARAAYPLYEQFRPAVPAGKRGWGAKGVLDLDLIGRLAAGTGSAGGRPGPPPATRPAARRS